MAEASRILGVSPDTLRRWEGNGRIACVRDGRNRRTFPVDEVRRLARTGSSRRPPFSARNRFEGFVTGIRSDGVMAIVEVDASGQQMTAAITADAVEELGLEIGSTVVATVKATSVMIEGTRG